MSNKKYLFVALSGAIASMFVGCQSDAIELAGDEGANEYTYNISADANQVSTRALSLGGNGKEINSTWLEGEEIIAYVLSDENKSKRTEYGLLSSMGEGKTTKFQGTIVSNKKQLSTSDDICFLYPGAASKGANKTISPVIAKEGGVRHEPSKTIAQRVELNLTRQDGKVETIGKRFDYQWAKAKPTQVQGQNVKVTIGTVKRVVSIWGLRFADSNNQILSNIDSVYISNVKSTDVFDLGTGNLVDNNASDDNMNIAIVPNLGEKLSSVGGKYTYLAALPGNYTDYRVYEESTPPTDDAPKKEATKNTWRKDANKGLSFNEQKEYNRLEKEIAQLEEKKTAIEAAFAEGNLSNDEIQSQSVALQETLVALEEKTERWFELTERFDN